MSAGIILFAAFAVMSYSRSSGFHLPGSGFPLLRSIRWSVRFLHRYCTAYLRRIAVYFHYGHRFLRTCRKSDDQRCISRRIVNFANCLVGNVRGGMSLALVLACAFFAALIRFPLLQLLLLSVPCSITIW